MCLLAVAKVEMIIDDNGDDDINIIHYQLVMYDVDIMLVE